MLYSRLPLFTPVLAHFFLAQHIPQLLFLFTTRQQGLSLPPQSFQYSRGVGVYLFMACANDDDEVVAILIYGYAHGSKVRTLMHRVGRTEGMGVAVVKAMSLVCRGVAPQHDTKVLQQI